jgi:ankyrin repeat protein
LHCAAINPNGDILKYMLEVCGNIFVNDEDMRKPIHYAACAATDAALKVLLELKCDTRITDADKMTPVMYAARAGRVHNIRLICENIA